MILYVNGDSHAAGAEAVNVHSFAEDDKKYFYLGRAPHPDNLEVCWGKLLSRTTKSSFHCDAESASSNARILRTTRDFINQHTGHNELLLIIQWSTWEREEWLHQGTYYQVNASGIDIVPQELQEKYRHYVIGTDWEFKTNQAHKEIWALHQELEAKGIKHIFLNGNNDFSKVADRYDWGTSYIGPYDPTKTFNSVIRAQGIDTVAPNSWHFGKEGHSYFHRFMLQYIIDNQYI